MSGKASLTPIHLPSFGANIAHGFFGRAGGVSQGLYGGLNCGLGSGDGERAVLENRARVAVAMAIAPGDLLNVYQTHSPNVISVETAHSCDQMPEADGMVTSQPGLGLTILTADCAPVLFADEDARVIGAAHGGWKGALAGVLENTLIAMEALGAKRGAIHAAIGPTISQANYEVGPEFRDRFIDAEPDNHRFFKPSAKTDHALFDLPAYCGHRLIEAGLNHVLYVATCTYADDKAYFSYRRATHRGEADYGRNISVITLRP